MHLVLATDLGLPLDTVTQAVGILAKRRAGKSYLARRFAEQLHAAGQQIVVIDPKGDWWGARSAADGKSPGMPIVILGGDHGDLPLTPTSGAVVARLAVEERVSVLLDLSLLRKHEVATFMAVFLEDLYRLKARAEYRTPLMLFVDEADAIAPQKPAPNEMRMLGAMSDVVRRGGQRGLGCCVITQRSAVLSKDVLTQVQVLITLRTMSPQDLAAIKAWIDVHGTAEQQKILMESLPSLPIGDAWFWSPGWPTEAGIFQRSHVLPITTFDSGATPKAGEAVALPKYLAEVDLQAVRRQMAEAIVAAEQEDPKFLKALIVELQKQLAAKATVAPVVAPFDRVAAERLVLKAAFLRDQRTKALTDICVTAKDLAQEMGRLLDVCQQALDSFEGDNFAMDLEEFFDGHEQEVVAGPVVAPAAPPRVAPAEIPGLPTGEAAVLAVVLNARGGATKALIKLETKFKVRYVNQSLQRLRIRSLVQDSDGRWFATAQGFKGPEVRVEHRAPPPGVVYNGVGDSLPLPELVESAAVVLGDQPPAPAKLEKVDRLLLQVLGQHGKMPLSRAAMLAGYPSTTSTTRNSATKLRGLGFIEGKAHEVAITDAGRAQVGKIEKLPKRGPQLLDYWCDRLEKVDGKILRVLVKRHPTRTLQAPLITAAGYEPAKSTGRNSMTKLRALGLVSGKDSEGGIVVRQELVK